MSKLTKQNLIYLLFGGMNTQIFLILVCSLIIVAACNNSSKVSGDIIVLNGIEAVKNTKELKLSDIAESIEYVKLETLPECLVSEGSFVVGKKYIVCFNRKPGNVLLFTRGGKFLRTIGSRGKGPQEVEFPTNVDLSPDEDRILIESLGFPGKVVEFTIEGKFIRSSQIPYMSESGIKYFGSQHFIYLQNRYYRDSLNYPRVIVLDHNLANAKTLYKIDNIPNHDRKAAYQLRSLMGRMESGFNFRDCLNDTLYYVDESLTIKAKYTIKVGKNRPSHASMTQIEWDSYQNDIEMINEVNDYVFMLAQIDGKRAHLVYDKKSGEIFSLIKQSNCEGKSIYGYGLTDDLMGMELYWAWDALDLRLNFISEPLEMTALKELVETECFKKNDQLKTTSYRGKLKELVNNSSIDDNPILRIIHLK